MASYEKHPKTKLWSVRYYGKDDKGVPRQLRFSGGFKTKKEAQVAFEEFIAKKREEKNISLSLMEYRVKKAGPLRHI